METLIVSLIAWVIVFAVFSLPIGVFYWAILSQEYTFTQCYFLAVTVLIVMTATNWLLNVWRQIRHFSPVKARADMSEPVQMWAVFTPKGNMYLAPEYQQAHARRRAVEIQKTWKLTYNTWREMEMAGYTVRRVEVREVESHEIRRATH